MVRKGSVLGSSWLSYLKSSFLSSTNSLLFHLAFFFRLTEKGKISPRPSFYDSVDMNEAVVGQESIFLMNESTWTGREEFDF